MSNYNQHHNIAYDYTPKDIFYPRDEVQVVQFVKYFGHKKFTIRSGGHHHEAMCTAHNGFVIDMSKFSKEVKVLSYNDCKKYFLQDSRISEEQYAAWLPSNLTNQEALNLPALMVGDVLKKIIPVGSCSQVSLGGYLLGGGWNLLARKYGWACDSIIAIEIVLADGSVEIVSEMHLPDLFQALKGSGGGNFGIVTRFLVQLYPAENIWSFAKGGIHLNGEKKNIKSWVNQQLSNDDNTTAFITISDNLLVNYGGYHVLDDNRSELEDIDYRKIVKQNLEKKYFGHKFSVFQISHLKPSGTHESFIQSFPDINLTTSFNLFEKLNRYVDLRFPFEYNELLSASELETVLYKCNESVAHKVTSAFLKDEYCTDATEFINTIENFLIKNKIDQTYNIITLHALGGKVNNKKNSIAYNNKILVQIQSWWIEKEDASKCRSWVESFRKHLETFLEGAFINFQDANIDLENYYKDKYQNLQLIKRKYDINNVFNFPMSIQLK